MLPSDDVQRWRLTPDGGVEMFPSDAHANASPVLIRSIQEVTPLALIRHKDSLTVAVVVDVGLPVARSDEPNTRSGFVRISELQAKHQVTRVGINRATSKDVFRPISHWTWPGWGRSLRSPFDDPRSSGDAARKGQDRPDRRRRDRADHYARTGSFPGCRWALGRGGPSFVAGLSRGLGP